MLTAFMQYAWDHLPPLIEGAKFTLFIWVIAVSAGFFLGWILTILRVYGNKPVRMLAIAYIELFRGTPMLTQMFIIYLGLPSIGIVFSPTWAAIWAIGLNTAAYQAEYFRGGVSVIPKGQMEAARAIGLSKIQAVKSVLIPQAFRIALPQWLNEVILELKYTSIAFTIGVLEIMGSAQEIGAKSFAYFEIFLVAAIMYFVIVNILTLIFDQIEKRFALKH